MTSNRGTKTLAICWVIALPLLTALTNISWYVASPPDSNNRPLESLLALSSSVGLLAALSLGVCWSAGRKKIISSAVFYRTMLASVLIALLLTATMTVGLFISAPEAQSGKDPSAIPGTGSAYILAAFAMPAALSAVLAAVAIYTLAGRKNWSRNTATTGTVIVCSLIICLGAGLLTAAQTSALGPPTLPAPAARPNPMAPPLPTEDPNASVLPVECPTVRASSVQALRIPASNPESIVTSVLNTFSTWLNSGSELMRLPQWRTAPAHCVNLLASAYGNAYTSSIFTNQAGAAWLQYFNGQVALNAKLLEALRTSNPDADWSKPASYRLEQIIDTSSNRSGNYLKFDATLVSSAAVDWQNADKSARWYVQLVQWEDFYIIDYVEAT